MERILIIEDELPMRTALQDVLAGEGYRVLTAADGASGLTRALEEKPDLLLLDLNFDLLLARRNTSKSFRAVPAFPPIRRDVAMVVPDPTTHEAVLQVIKQTKWIFTDKTFTGWLPRMARGSLPTS